MDAQRDVPGEDINNGIVQEELGADNNGQQQRAGDESNDYNIEEQEKMRADSMLSGLFSHGFGEVSNQTKVLKILQENPHFATYTYKVRGEEMYPLRIFVQNSFHLSIVRRVLELYPEAISHRNRHCLTVLQSALVAQASVEVINFLIDRYPEAVSIPDFRGHYPIRSALEDYVRAPVELVKKLLDLHPEANSAVFVPLVIKRGHDLDIVELLLEPQKKDLDYLELSGWDFSVVTIHCAESIALALPHVKHFTCVPREWTDEGLVHVLRAMERCRATLRTVKFAFPEAFLGPITSEHGNLLQFLQRDSAVQEVSFLCGSDAGRRDDDFLPLLAPCLRNNNVLQTLCLESFAFSNGLRCIEFLSSGLSPACVRLNHCECMQTIEQTLDYGDCRIERLVLEGCKFGSSFLDHLCKSPKLTNLEINGTEFINFTKPLIALLRRNKIRSIDMLGLVFDFEKEALLNELKTNTSLQTCTLGHFGGFEEDMLLEILKSHNLTLCDIQFDGSRCYVDSIQYYALLNKFGRGRIRELNTGASELVHLLRELEDTPADTPFFAGNCHMKDSVRYGLLRERPGLLNAALLGSHVSNQEAHLRKKRKTT